MTDSELSDETARSNSLRWRSVVNSVTTPNMAVARDDGVVAVPREGVIMWTMAIMGPW